MMGPEAAAEWTTRAHSVVLDRHRRSREELHALVEELTREADAYVRGYHMVSPNEYRNRRPDRQQLPPPEGDAERDEQRQAVAGRPRRRNGLFKMLHGAMASLDELIELFFDDNATSPGGSRPPALGREQRAPRWPPSSPFGATAAHGMRPASHALSGGSHGESSGEQRMNAPRRFERLGRLRAARISFLALRPPAS